MKFIAAASTVGALVSLVGAQTPDPFINTPTGVTTCLTTNLGFGGTHPPFTLVALPGGQATGTPIETIVSGVNGTSYSWLVNLPPGTYTSLEIRDNLGNLQYSSPITVLTGTSTSCVGSNGGTTVTNPGSSTSGGAPTSTPAQTTSAAGSSSSAAGSSSSAMMSSSSVMTSMTSMASTSSTAAHSSTTSSKSGAGQLDAKFGVAGLLGLIGAAAML